MVGSACEQLVLITVLAVGGTLQQININKWLFNDNLLSSLKMEHL